MRQGNRSQSNIHVARVFAKGRRLGAKNYALFILDNDVEQFRYRVIVGKKYGKAVERNRIRRRIREILRTECQGIVPGVDLLFLPRRELHDTDHPTLKDVVVNALIRARRSVRKEPPQVT